MLLACFQNVIKIFNETSHVVLCRQIQNLNFSDRSEFFKQWQKRDENVMEILIDPSHVALSQPAHSNAFRSESEYILVRDRNPIRSRSQQIHEQTLSDMSADRSRVRSEFSLRTFEVVRYDRSVRIGRCSLHSPLSLSTEFKNTS